MSGSRKDPWLIGNRIVVAGAVLGAIATMTLSFGPLELRPADIAAYIRAQDLLGLRSAIFSVAAFGFVGAIAGGFGTWWLVVLTCCAIGAIAKSPSDN